MIPAPPCVDLKAHFPPRMRGISTGGESHGFQRGNSDGAHPALCRFSGAVAAVGVLVVRAVLLSADGRDLLYHRQYQRIPRLDPDVSGLARLAGSLSRGGRAPPA